MVFAALVLLCAVPQNGDTARPISDSSAIVAENNSKDIVAAKDVSLSLPAAPSAKVKTDAEVSAEPAAAAFPPSPLKSALSRPQETRLQRRTWYALAVVSHGGAAFDAWSTRRAISGGYGTESNPFLRPFSHSNAMYAATQVSPAVMDYIGKRMMVSQDKWVRRLWWVPQTVGGSFSFAAGIHNVGLVP